MRSVYLVQPNYGTGSGEFTSHWLPYSAGCLWAYAAQFPDITEHYVLAGLYFQRTPVDEVLARMHDPAVVGFSTYIWNANYNSQLAQAVKLKWPQATIVFGGPQVPDLPHEFFARHPYVDFTVHQEGELTFTRLLRRLLDPKAEPGPIPGIAFVGADGQVVKNASSGRVDSLEQLPSPYLTGVFDDVIRENPRLKWAATYETNRGCPFKCHFCDWGSVIFSKVKQFPEDRARRELGWLAEHRVEYVFVGDANFGIFKERDGAIADHILDVVHRTGYPKNFCIQWTKNSNSDIVRMARKLSSVQKGLTLSVQSMTEQVLAAVERRNMAINNLSEILEICNREGLPSYTELILGLPEETLESWKECFHRLLELGQHCSIDVWIAQVLQNSALNAPEELARFAIETVSARNYLTGARGPTGAERDEIPEEIRLVRSTSSMPFADLIDSYMYAWMILNFHIYGWTQFSSRFMHGSGRMPYRDYYGRLFDYIRSDATHVIRGEYESTKRRITDYLTTGEIDGGLIDEMGLALEISGHNLMWLSQMRFRSRGRQVFDELRPFWGSLADALSSELEADLVTAQEHALVFYGERYPREFTLGSNLVETVLLGHPPSNDRRHRYRADYRREVREVVADIESMSETNFLYMLYYKRRLGPGTTAVTSLPPPEARARVSDSLAAAELHPRGLSTPPS